MTIPSDRSSRFARWWVRRYTAGTAAPLAGQRRHEIASDLADHARARRCDGWPPRRVVRERLARTVRGVPADLAWRRDVLAADRGLHGVRYGVLVTVTSASSLLLAVFCGAFAAYMLGAESVAHWPFLGGLDSFADEVGRYPSSVVASVIIAGAGGVLLVAVMTRPVSPLLANALTMAVSSLAIMWFWMGVWPLGLLALVGATVDMVVRSVPAEPRP